MTVAFKYTCVFGFIIKHHPTHVPDLKNNNKLLHHTISLAYFHSHICHWYVKIQKVTHNKIDIILDTFPYSGGITTFEATWMGVPVLTKKGFNRFSSHETESINHNSGMSDWIANDENEYLRMSKSSNPFGDGFAAKKIVEVLAKWFTV